MAKTKYRSKDTTLKIASPALDGSTNHPPLDFKSGTVEVDDTDQRYAQALAHALDAGLIEMVPEKGKGS